MVCAMKNEGPLTDLGDDELRAQLDDDSLSLARQLRVLDELSRRATARKRVLELAELVATVPVMSALDDSAEMVREAQAWLQRAKWTRARAVQSAIASGYSLRTVAEIARVAPSTAIRLRDEELPDEPPPA